MRHLSVGTLIDQIENKADAAALAETNQHLSECERCQNNAGEFSQLLTFLNNDATNEPPADLLEWGIQLFQPVLRPTESKTSKVLRVAKLVFDSFEQPAPVGIRYVGSVPRQLLFRAGKVDVDVRIESGDDRVSLAGQVLSESERFFENTPVRLESHGVVRYKTQTNPVGEFLFDEVPQDTYHLSVDLPDGQVTLFCVHRRDAVLA
jgi:hypothetical protein